MASDIEIQFGGERIGTALTVSEWRVLHVYDKEVLNIRDPSDLQEYVILRLIEAGFNTRLPMEFLRDEKNRRVEFRQKVTNRRFGDGRELIAQ